VDPAAARGPGAAAALGRRRRAGDGGRAHQAAVTLSRQRQQPGVAAARRAALAVAQPAAGTSTSDGLGGPRWARRAQLFFLFDYLRRAQKCPRKWCIYTDYSSEAFPKNASENPKCTPLKIKKI